MTEKQKDSFLLYLEHEELINELSDEEAGKLIKGLFEYVKTGEPPTLSAISNIAFISIRQDLDRNAKKYEAKVEALRRNGKKGGRPRKDESEESNKNQMVLFETKKSLYDNDNDNVNVLSLNEENTISRDEREILEKYIKRNKLADKNVRAYANKIIANGDWKDIVESESRIAQKNNKSNDKDRIKAELSTIYDKRSCAKVLATYFMRGSPPEEFDEVMEKYQLSTYRELEEYANELSIQNSNTAG